MSDLVDRLRERRAQVWEEAKRLADRAFVEGREMDGLESQQWTALNGELDTLDDRLRSLLEGAQRARQTEEAFTAIHGAERGRGHQGGELFGGASELAAQFRSRARTGSSEPVVTALRCGFHAAATYAPVETRDIVTTTGPGFHGVTFGDTLVRGIVETASVAAAGARLLTTQTGEPYTVPRSTGISTAAYVAEASAYVESDPTFVAYQLQAYKCGFMLQVSMEMLQDETFGLESFLAWQAGVAVGNKIGADFVSGAGSAAGAPLGVLTVASGQAAVTGASAVSGAANYDNMIDLLALLPEPMTRSGSVGFLMKASTLNGLRKLKDTTGRYLYDVWPSGPNSLAAGQILGHDVFVDPYMPTAATGAYSIVVGDFSRYWIRQTMNVEFIHDNGYYAFRATWRGDGAVVDTTAFRAFRGNAS